MLRASPHPLSLRFVSGESSGLLAQEAHLLGGRSAPYLAGFHLGLRCVQKAARRVSRRRAPRYAGVEWPLGLGPGQPARDSLHRLPLAGFRFSLSPE